MIISYIFYLLEDYLLRYLLINSLRRSPLLLLEAGAYFNTIRLRLLLKKNLLILLLLYFINSSHISGLRKYVKTINRTVIRTKYPLPPRKLIKNLSMSLNIIVVSPFFFNIFYLHINSILTYIYKIQKVRFILWEVFYYLF